MIGNSFILPVLDSKFKIDNAMLHDVKIETSLYLRIDTLSKRKKADHIGGNDSLPLFRTSVNFAGCFVLAFRNDCG